MESSGGKFETTMEELAERLEQLEKQFLGKETPSPAKTPFAPVSTTSRKIAELSELSFIKEKANTTTKLPMLQPLSFNGVDLDDFLDEFSRWLRLSGVSGEDDSIKIDWLIEFSSPKVRPIVKKLARDYDTLKEVLEGMSKLFPKMENDLTLRAKLDKIPPLQFSPEPAQVAKLFLDLEEIFGKMSRDALSDEEKFLILLKKIHQRTFQD